MCTNMVVYLRGIFQNHVKWYCAPRRGGGFAGSPSQDWHLTGLKSGERLKGRRTGVIAVLETALLISEIGWPHGYVSGPLPNPQQEGAKSNRLITLIEALV